jgi:hypothetical protein
LGRFHPAGHRSIAGGVPRDRERGGGWCAGAQERTEGAGHPGGGEAVPDAAAAKSTYVAGGSDPSTSPRSAANRGNTTSTISPSANQPTVSNTMG